MKKFDYLCLLYSILLLIFGFSDDVPGKKERVSKPGEARNTYYVFAERRMPEVVVAQNPIAAKTLKRPSGK